MGKGKLILSGAIIFVLGLLAGATLLSKAFLEIPVEKHIKLGFAISPWVSVFTAAATIVIAVFTGVNAWLASTIQSREDEFRQQVSDLYKAITISNLMRREQTSDVFIEENMRLFNKTYKEKAKGKTPIFD